MKHVAVGLIKADQSIMYGSVRKDMEKIARTAGVEMKKTASVILRAECFQDQAEGLKILNGTLKEIETTASRDTVIGQVGIATGYANAMQHLELMSESELEDIIAVIKQTGERSLRRIETTKPIFSIR